MTFPSLSDGNRYGPVFMVLAKRGDYSISSLKKSSKVIFFMGVQQFWGRLIQFRGASAPPFHFATVRPWYKVSGFY